MLFQLVLFFVVCAKAFATIQPPHEATFWNNRRSASAAEIDQYVAAHNQIRKAFHVQSLQWSSDLAKKAQTWADHCQFEHSNGTLSEAPYGENIVAATGSFPISIALGLFSSDEAGYNSTSPTYNHFTQVVWKSTKNLGCAFSKCNSIFGHNRLATMYVCLYQPPGNVIGQAL
ncbi:hypothetical protein M378DRAFT_68199 [Amanita muscaria Koide BX008]|uniref:SCP domain-containing protein n=1 Tax=Amanita muscaria (strain Koide BX008) TaxID=946122 RepID=A0A0C2TSI9_AMAMK|nr:hypothetical protein M378DRAFT_68199 [Amanita muscaria Koide BX008]